MLQPRLSGSSMTVGRDAAASLSTLAAAFNSLTLCSKHSHPRSQLPTSFAFVRHASHAAQGRANGPKDSAGRRLGAKKSASEYVIPGNIIFKQRGTKWFPGENTDMGKDHTIYATVSGYVRYYRNPALHPKRRYIGVALEREGPKSKLPTPANAPTRRRLGMYAAPIREQSDADFLNGHLSTNSKGSRPMKEGSAPKPSVSGVPLRPGKFWPSNYEIGKTAERLGVVVKEFDRSNRWLAWRKRTKRVKEKVLARASKATRKTKGKKSNKGANAVRK